jgi:hypothetical protein
VTRAACASGEVRIQNPLVLNDDSLIGIGVRRAMNKGGVTADGKQVMHTLPVGEIQISKDDLLDWLNRQPFEKRQAMPPARRGGRPPAVDWNVMRSEALRLMDHHGNFSADDPEWSAVERLYDALQHFCNSKFGREVGRTTLQEHVTPWLSEWRTAAGN